MSGKGARADEWEGAEETREMDTLSGHPLSAVQGHALSATGSGKGEMTLALVTPLAIALLHLRLSEHAGVGTVMAMAPEGDEPLRSHFIRRPPRPARRPTARPGFQGRQMRPRTRSAPVVPPNV